MLGELWPWFVGHDIFKAVVAAPNACWDTLLPGNVGETFYLDEQSGSQVIEIAVCVCVCVSL